VDSEEAVDVLDLIEDDQTQNPADPWDGFYDDRGLIHFRFGKRAKSESVEAKGHPCSIASAARCASVTSLATACPSVSICLKKRPMPFGRSDDTGTRLVQPALNSLYGL
jgi:hypothetical protein